MDKILITFTIEEIDDLISNLDECIFEGYINNTDPAWTATNKLKDAYFKWKDKDQ